MTTRTLGRAATAATVVVGLAVAGACGRDSRSSGVASLGGGRSAKQQTTTTLAPEDAMVQFARCMREHGVRMADPDPERGSILRMEGNDPETVRKAEQACQHLAPPDVGGEDSGDTMERLRQMARCMRGKGYEVADPVIVDGPSGRGGTPPEEDEPDFDVNDPRFQAAERECSREAGIDAPGAGAAGAGREG